MKIHIVQKGDTLWNLAQKYGVNFEEVKQLNAQLADPNQIMPGMKIKIPTSTKQVQKQPVNDKTMHPYKDVSKKAQPVMYEDDTKKTTPVKKQMPVKAEPMPVPQPIQLPNLPDFYSTNYNIDVDIEDNDTEINQHNFQYTEHQTQPQPQPIQQPIQQQMPQPMQPSHHMMQQPCMPCMPPMQQMPMQYPQQQMPSFAPVPMDPCHQFQSPQSLIHGQPPVYQGYDMGDEMESSSIEMPPMPNQYMNQQTMPLMQQNGGQWNTNPGIYSGEQQGNAPMPQYNMTPNGYNQTPPPNGMQQGMPQGTQPGMQMPQGLQPGMQMPTGVENAMDQPFYPTQQGAPGMMQPQMDYNMPFQPMPQMGSPYPYRMTEDDEGIE
ncbi:SafA/ExsA family spore coat assembly protein [Paraliobacillus zengyii]|uniref:SafA/ExsA family spore coat assembly protein n=1 Tax=Paraliobacillus zengyii TaxID=2213194 RepID=UPI000DD3E7D8|nr:SafA/ExsA family spore coat assembly protein [Paraliobacillus zengyii]